MIRLFWENWRWMGVSNMLMAIVQEFETSISSKQRDVCPNPKVRHTKPAIPTEIDGNLHGVMMYHVHPCTTCFTRLAPYPASAKALKVPDIQRSKPGNPRRKKNSEKTLRNHELENKNSTKISSEKCRKSTDSRCQRTTHRPILGMERLGTRVQNLHSNTMALKHLFFLSS